MATIDPITEAAILRIASAGEAENSFWVSSAKVEKVVNAPSNPVTASG